MQRWSKKSGDLRPCTTELSPYLDSVITLTDWHLRRMVCVSLWKNCRVILTCLRTPNRSLLKSSALSTKVGIGQWENLSVMKMENGTEKLMGPSEIFCSKLPHFSPG